MQTGRVFASMTGRLTPISTVSAFGITGASWSLLIAAAISIAALRAEGAAQPDWATAKRVRVVTVEYRFQPNHLVFRRGVAYRLHLVNRGKELHELTAPKFFQAVELRDPQALNAEHTEIVVQPAEIKDVYFVAPRPGHFAMWCADHDWAGMTGDITVK